MNTEMERELDTGCFCRATIIVSICRGKTQKLNPCKASDSLQHESFQNKRDILGTAPTQQQFTIEVT